MAEGLSPTVGQDAPVAPVPFIDLVAQHQRIAPAVMEAVGQCFADQKFIMGETVATFEQEVAEFCDSRYALGCASGTDALVLALMAHDIGPGDEVITSPFTFFATASSIHRVGAVPVFVDIDPTSYNLDPTAVEAAITPRTKAIMPVHLFGQCAEMDPLWRIAVREKITIIEDACQAIGAEYRGRRAGVLGSIAAFSFFPTKNLGGAGDGGLITTDDPELAARMKRLRVHGDIGNYNHVEIGLNSRLDALQAAVLRIKLQHLEHWTLRRQANARRYEELFRHYRLLDVIRLPETLPERRHVYNQYCVQIAEGKRDEVLASMRAQQIGAMVYYPIPLHLQQCFKPLGYKAGDFPVSEATSQNIMALPIFAELTADQQETVVRGVAKALGRFSTQRGPATVPAPKFLHQEKRVA